MQGPASTFAGVAYVGFMHLSCKKENAGSIPATGSMEIDFIEGQIEIPSWEYKIVGGGSVALLDPLGAEGWEAVAIDAGYVLLKRPTGTIPLPTKE